MLGDSVRRRQPNAGKPARAPRKPRERPIKWGTIIPATLGALLIPFGVGYALAVYVMFPAPKTSSVGGIAVPDLVGRTVAEADQLLDAAGLGDITKMELPHPDAATGQITAQDPLPGQQLRAGSNVAVSVSSGPAKITVPDVTGFAAEAAQQVLVRMGFDTRLVNEPALAAVGRVIRIDPVAGTALRLPATITIAVSAGPGQQAPRPDSVLPPDTGAVSPRRH